MPTVNKELLLLLFLKHNNHTPMLFIQCLLDITDKVMNEISFLGPVQDSQIST